MNTQSQLLNNENEVSALPFVDQEDIVLELKPTKVEVNPNCFLRLTIVSGTWVEDADFFGKQDPLIIFTHNGKEYRTKVQEDAGKAATFNEVFDLYGL